MSAAADAAPVREECAAASGFKRLLFCLDDPHKYREQLEKELADALSQGAQAQILLINPHPALPAYSASNVLGLVHAANALQRRTAAAEAVLRELIQRLPEASRHRVSLHLFDDCTTAEDVAGAAIRTGSDRIVLALAAPGKRLQALAEDVTRTLRAQDHVAAVVSTQDAAEAACAGG